MKNSPGGRLSRWFVLSLLTSLFLLLQGLVLQADEELGWFPEMLYADQMSDEEVVDDSYIKSDAVASRRSAAPGLAAWALEQQLGEQGRPLPVTGSWMADGLFSPDWFIELIEDGHHVIPTFLGVSGQPIRAYVLGDERQQKRIEDRLENYYRPALEYARKHRLPIAIREWNWSSMPGLYQEINARAEGRELTLEENVRVVIDGKAGNAADPFGPIEGWKAWGSFWTGNPMLRAIQEIYPDPPMVIFLDNNEGPKVRSANDIPKDYDRMIAFLGGDKPADRRAVEKAIREGYMERHAAMKKAAREAFVEPAWRDNVRFVAYNNLWDTGYIGDGNRPQESIWFDRDEGWLAWRMNDGGQPELYDNDWQLGKTDYRPWSMQTEAMNYYSAQDWIFERDPDFYWSAIIWDGERPGNIWRGRRSTSKTYYYVTRGQRWDFDRYEGWLQYSLWVTRPREYREFRGNTEEDHAYNKPAFMRVVDAVDRPWNHPVLREFWRHGELVPNRAEQPWFELSESQPEWVKDFERWYLLTNDANPPRDTWENNTVLRVFPLALVLGEAPDRRWLIYAHAPLGAVPYVTVTIPDYGDVLLSSVPKSGAFYMLNEQDRSLTLLVEGGPAELILKSDPVYAKPESMVNFEASIAHAPGVNFTGFIWNFGDGQTMRQDELEPVQHTYKAQGEYLVTLTGKVRGGEDLVEQTVVFVDEGIEGDVLYALSLQNAFLWEGPFDHDNRDKSLVTYQHLPNRGQLPSPIVVGGRFVEDEERGQVYELTGEPYDGVYLLRGQPTNMSIDGHPNRTIAFSFKAEDTESRQVLYAEGTHHAGLNIYIDDGQLYAGAWAPVDGQMFSWFPVYGRNWPGDWVVYKNIEPGQWYDVVLIFEDTTEQVEDDKMLLYVNGELVAKGPAARMPRVPAGPRLGRAHLDGMRNLLTVFHDGENDDVVLFKGRMGDFKLINSTVKP